ncbi:hypothetical protein ANN_02668 [Periplaneta americana]|uniref:Uncharacterized protein n=1 Tax=Periplaneta americana TaxID=6978 RepID=A0ABQ8TY23_PERAM|nr:hypothetical protein ANN_02668 [Periplaneta americana]
MAAAVENAPTLGLCRYVTLEIEVQYLVEINKFRSKGQSVCAANVIFIFLHCVDGNGDSEMVFGEMRPRIRYRLPDIRLTVEKNHGKNRISGSRAVASWSKASCLLLALRNARWFESSWGKKFSREISASVWDRSPPSIVMSLESYDRVDRFRLTDVSVDRRGKVTEDEEAVSETCLHFINFNSVHTTVIYIFDKQASVLGTETYEVQNARTIVLCWSSGVGDGERRYFVSQHVNSPSQYGRKYISPVQM